MQVNFYVSGSVRVTDVLVDTKLPRMAEQKKRIWQQRREKKKRKPDESFAGRRLGNSCLIYPKFVEISASTIVENK